MTHAESQDLLLDLAFGELDARRAAEVEEHLAGCAECRKEKATLDEARRVSAPLRELEEPPPGFDERILAAARAEAHHQHDGNVGQVIEVTGDVRPLGVEPARIDAHAPVRARPAERRRPKWMVRAALGGSVAAAAALALVVSTTLDARRTAQKVSQAQSEDYRIRVKPATPEAVDSALRDAEANRERDRGALAKEKEAAAQPPPPAAAEKKQDRAAQLPPPARKLAADRAAGMEGSGGDAAESRAARRRDAASPGPSSTVPASSERRVAAPGGAAPAGQPAASGGKASANGAAAPSTPSAPAQAVSRPEAATQVTAQEPAAGLKAESRAKASTAAPARTPAELEASAQQARHAGNYVLAASLYRSAADLRRNEEDVASAAWNLAHAVECLSAVARFEEARQVRDELVRLYPSQTTALSAARRALREVDVPESPAAKQK